MQAIYEQAVHHRDMNAAQMYLAYSYESETPRGTLTPAVDGSSEPVAETQNISRDIRFGVDDVGGGL